MTTGEVLENLHRDTKDLRDNLSIPRVQKAAEYYLRAGESGQRPPEPPWQATIERAKRIVRYELIGKFEIANSVQAGEVEGNVTIVHEGGLTFASTELADVSEHISVEHEPIPLELFVIGSIGSIQKAA